MAVRVGIIALRCWSGWAGAGCGTGERKLLDEFLLARALEHDAPDVPLGMGLAVVGLVWLTRLRAVQRVRGGRATPRWSRPAWASARSWRPP